MTDNEIADQVAAAAWLASDDGHSWIEDAFRRTRRHGRDSGVFADVLPGTGTCPASWPGPLPGHEL